MKNSSKTYAAALLAVFAVIAFSACGGSSNTASPAAGTTGSTDTVSTSDVQGVGTVLVDSKGMALYSPDQEKSGTIMCTSECTSIWIPLTVSGSPTSPSAVASK